MLHSFLNMLSGDPPLLLIALVLGIGFIVAISATQLAPKALFQKVVVAIAALPHLVLAGMLLVLVSVGLFTIKIGAPFEVGWPVVAAITFVSTLLAIVGIVTRQSQRSHLGFFNDRAQAVPIA